MDINSLPLCRSVNIDFNRMTVYGKSLRVRRLDDGNTVWIWYCTLRRKWNKYGEKVDGITPFEPFFLCVLSLL